MRNRASMQRRPLPYRFLAALLLLVIFPHAMPAQSTSASLTGRITDSRRTVISEATVEHDVSDVNAFRPEFSSQGLRQPT